jgi:monovalent cation/hydrogen antiporter
MQHLDVLLLILVSAVASLLVLSRISRVPCPVLLVTGGVLLGFVPGVPRV